uniref:Uncharacterized protein n=1 Tax=Romanomermis culicivorax TaxID=13658 RepID=A0A915L5L3_ROMCU
MRNAAVWLEFSCSSNSKTVLKGFLGGVGAVPPLVNVGVGVTMLSPGRDGQTCLNIGQCPYTCFEI